MMSKADLALCEQIRQAVMDNEHEEILQRLFYQLTLADDKEAVAFYWISQTIKQRAKEPLGD